MTLTTNGEYQNAKVSTGFREVPVATIPELKQITTLDWSPGIYKDGVRKLDSWTGSDFLYIDVDNAVYDAAEATSIDYCLGWIQAEMYIITSRNHGKKKPDGHGGFFAACDRFHILFPLKERCFDPKMYQLWIKALIAFYPFADKAATGAARFFFGVDSPNVYYNRGQFRFDISGPPENVEVEPENMTRKLSRAEFTNNTLEDKKVKLLEKLREAASQGLFANYHDWLSLGMGMKTEGFSCSDWLGLSWETEGMTSLEAKWNGFKRSDITGGTLMHYARKVDPDFMVKRDRSSPSNILSGKVVLLDERRSERQATSDWEGDSPVAVTEDKPMATAFPLTQMGNVDRMVYHHGQDLRYVSDADFWLVWTGSKWERDMKGKIANMTKGMIENIYQREWQLHSKQNDKGAEVGLPKLEKFIQSCSNTSHIDGIISMLGRMNTAAIPVLSNELDRDPMKFQCANGTLNLETGILETTERTDLITHGSYTTFNANAVSPLWESFLATVFKGSEDLIRFVKQYAGYALTGLPPSRIMVFFYGHGKNGKSTLVNVLAHILGDYAKAARTDTFVEGSPDKIAQDLVNLRGARMIYFQETEDGQKLDEAKIKAMTGGDKITGRYIYSRHEISFVNTGKLIGSTNHKPRISGTDKGIWDRMRLVHFAHEIPESERIANFEDLLKQEASGILNWMLDGLKDLRANGFKFVTPKEVVESTEEYRMEEDRVGQYIEECCQVDSGERVKASDLYKSYTEWCSEYGMKPYSLSRFGRDLVARGFERLRLSAGVHYSGLRMKYRI